MQFKMKVINKIKYIFSKTAYTHGSNKWCDAVFYIAQHCSVCMNQVTFLASIKKSITSDRFQFSIKQTVCVCVMSTYVIL